MQHRRQKAKRALILILCIVFLFQCIPVTASAAISQYASPSARYDTSEILIKYSHETTFSTIQAALRGRRLFRKYRVTALERAPQWLRVEIHDRDAMAAELQAFNAMPEVELAVPNDRLFCNATSETDVADAVASTAVEMNFGRAGQLNTQQAPVLVGLLDTGIDWDNENLQPYLYQNSAEQPGNGLDDDSNGYIDDRCGWNFADGTAAPSRGNETDDHATQVASLFVRALDAAGADTVRLVPLQIMKNGAGTTAEAIEAIEYARSLGVQIVNCSFGCAEYNIALKAAIESSGMLFICAAGNADSDGDKAYPASFGLPNVLSVGAMDAAGESAGYNHDGERIDLYAPGIGVETTGPQNQPATVSGTSFAAPWVTAAAALTLSAVPELGPQAARQCLAFSPAAGSSLLDARQAVENAFPYQILAQDDPVLSELLGYGRDTLTAGIAAILSRSEPALTAEDVTSLQHFFQLDATVYASIAEQGWPLYDTLLLAAAASRSGWAADAAAAIYRARPEDWADTLRQLGSYQQGLNIPAADAADCLALAAAGYPVEGILAAWLAAQALSQDIHMLISPQRREPQTTAYTGSEREALADLLQRYWLREDFLLGYLETHALSPSALEQRLNQWLIDAGISLTNSGIQPSGYGVFLSRYSHQYGVDQADVWRYGDFAVQKRSGMVSYARTLIELPGSGLSFGLRFDPEVSNLGSRGYAINEEFDCLETHEYYTLSGGMWVRYPTLDTSTKTRLQVAEMIDGAIAKDGMEVSVSATQKYIVRIQIQGGYNQLYPSADADYNRYDTSYHFGIGWIPTFPAVHENYVHLPDGRKYRICTSDRSLEGLRTQEFYYGYYTGNGPTIKGVKATCFLQYITGQTDYFDSSGRYLGSTDQTGNWTTVEYTANGISRLTDPTGRSLQFDYLTISATQKEIRISLYDDPQASTDHQLLYTLIQTKDPASGQYFLTHIHDALNRTLQYSYATYTNTVYENSRAVSAAVEPKYSRRSHTCSYVSLSSVQDPVGAKTIVSYQTAERMYGAFSTQQYQRAAGMYRQLNGSSTRYDEKWFTYQKVNRDNPADIVADNTAGWQYASPWLYPYAATYDGVNSIVDASSRESFFYNVQGDELATEVYDLSGASSRLAYQTTILARGTGNLPTQIKRKIASSATASYASGDYIFTLDTLQWDIYGNCLYKKTTQGSYYNSPSAAIEQTSPYALDLQTAQYYYTGSKALPYLTETYTQADAIRGSNSTVMRYTFTASGQIASATEFHTRYENDVKHYDAHQQTLYTYNDDGTLAKTLVYDYQGYSFTESAFQAFDPAIVRPGVGDNSQFLDLVPRETQYTYDRWRNRTQTLVKGVQDVDATTTYDIRQQTVYNYLGQCVRSDTPVKVKDGELLPGETAYSTAYTYDAAGRSRKTTAPNGAVSETVYDDTNRTITQKNTLQPDIVTHYDRFGQPTATEKRVIENGTTRTIPLTLTAYDTRLRPVSVTEYRSADQTAYRRASYTYAWDGTVKQTTNRTSSDGVTTIVTTDTSFAYRHTPSDIYNYTAVETADGNGNRLSRECTFTDAAGSVRLSTRYYDVSGAYYSDYQTVAAYQKVTDVSGETIVDARYGYDFGGRKNVEAKGTAGSGGNVVSARIYDSFGNVTCEGIAPDFLTSKEIPAENGTLYDYDVLDRCIRRRTPFDTVDDAVVYAQIKTVYDARGLVVKEQRSKQQPGQADAFITTENRYDSAGRLVLVKQTDGDRSEYTQYAYDKAGRMIRLFRGLTDPLTITVIGGDTLSPTVQVTAGPDADYVSTRYVYDAAGNLVHTVNPLSTAECTAYDDYGRVTRRYYRDADGNESDSVSYTYDLNDRLLSAGLDSYTYDVLGRKLTAVNGNYTTTYQYDDLGRVTGEALDAKGTGMTYQNAYGYDGMNLTSVQTSYEDVILPAIHYSYNDMGQNTNITYNNEIEVSKLYDTQGQLTRKTYSTRLYGMQASVWYAYNLAGLPDTIQYYNGMNRVTQEEYGYGLDGNVLQRTDYSGNTPTLQQTTTYQYQLDRLTEEALYSGAAITANLQKRAAYTFDDRGNMNTKVTTLPGAANVRQEDAYTYDAADRLTSLTTQLYGTDGAVASAENATYTYDVRGNRSRDYRNGEQTAVYDYDAANRLTRVQKPVENQRYADIGYRYDADGRRIGKYIDVRNSGGYFVSSNRVFHVWRGDQILMDDVWSSNWQLYIGLDTVEIIQHDAAASLVSNCECLLQDWQGTTKGSKWGSYTAYAYDAYGNSTDAFGYNPFRYTGQYFDEETGFYYLRARQYDPALGRFLQQDANTGSPADPATLNRYGYCGGNPVKYVDPSGRSYENPYMDPDVYRRLLEFEAVDAEFRRYQVWNMVPPRYDPNYIEPSPPKQLSFWDKVGGALAAFSESFEFEAGTGIGLGVSLGNSLVGGDFRIAYDLLNTNYSFIGVDLRHKGEAIANLKAGPFEIGPHNTYIDSHMKPGNPTEEFTWVKQNDTIELWSGGLYLIYGGSLTVSFNYKHFIKRVGSFFE